MKRGVLTAPGSCLSQGRQTLSKKEKRTLADYSDYIQDVVRVKKVRNNVLSIKVHFYVIVL